MTVSRRQLLSATAVAAGGLGLAGLASAKPGENFDTGISEADLEEFTESSRASIKKGTGWLIKAINSDGGAGLDIGTSSDVACSSVVGMALLSQGQTPMEGEHRNRTARLAGFGRLGANR